MTCKDKVNPGKRTTNTHTHTVLYESRNLGLFELLGPITTKVFQLINILNQTSYSEEQTKLNMKQVLLLSLS